MKMTEQLLWNYIEGKCTPKEVAAIEAAFMQNPALQAEWQERQQLHQLLAGSIELDAPSMRFTTNVMEALPKLYQSNHALSAAWLKRFGGAVFALSMLVIGFVLTSPNASDIHLNQRVTEASDSTLNYLLTSTSNDYIFFCSLVILGLTSLLLADFVWARKQKVTPS